MLKILPVVLVLLLIAGGLIYFRFRASEPVVSPASQTNQTVNPIEVPKTLPGTPLEDRVKNLEDALLKVVNKINSPEAAPATANSLDTRLKAAEAAVTELKVRVSSLEKGTSTTTTTQTTASTKVPAYIPLGSAGQASDVNWSNLGGFQASIDPAQYAGYSNMQLQVTFRLNQPGGTAYARLYNSSGSSAVSSSDVSTTSTSAAIVTSSGFTLSSGAKTYILQAKSSDGSQVFIDNATIKVNF